MRVLYWLTNETMARLRLYFPKSLSKPRVDDRRVLSGIEFVNRKVCAGVMRPRSMVPTRRSSVDGSGGVR